MRSAAVILFSLLAFGLAGCGGGDAPPAAGGDHSEDLVGILSDVPRPDSLDANGLAELATNYRGMAEDLGGLAPPQDVAEPHARMVVLMRTYADELARASQLTTSPGKFTSEMANAEATAKEWIRAFEEIKSRGYATVAAS
jgi:hypothetical protein